MKAEGEREEERTRVKGREGRKGQGCRGGGEERRKREGQEKRRTGREMRKVKKKWGGK